jgi:hypothetical protein
MRSTLRISHRMLVTAFLANAFSLRENRCLLMPMGLTVVQPVSDPSIELPGSRRYRVWFSNVKSASPCSPRSSWASQNCFHSSSSWALYFSKRLMLFLACGYWSITLSMDLMVLTYLSRFCRMKLSFAVAMIRDVDRLTCVEPSMG